MPTKFVQMRVGLHVSWSRRMRPALVLSLVALACGGGVGPDAPGTRRLLFLGNSLTYSNDLPAMVEALARPPSCRTFAPPRSRAPARTCRTCGSYGLAGHGARRVL